MEAYIVEIAKNTANGNPIAAYFLFFFNSVLQIIFPPYPGDSIIALQGYLSAKGILNPYLLIANIFIATYLASLSLYFVSFKYGHDIINKSFMKNLVDYNKINKIEKWFNKYGSIIIIAGKFIPGLGTIIFISAGLFKVQRVPAMVSIGVACILHNMALFLGGRFAGENTNYIASFCKEYSIYILIGIITISIIYILVKKYIEKKQNND